MYMSKMQLAGDKNQRPARATRRRCALPAGARTVPGSYSRNPASQIGHLVVGTSPLSRLFFVHLGYVIFVSSWRCLARYPESPSHLAVSTSPVSWSHVRCAPSIITPSACIPASKITSLEAGPVSANCNNPRPRFLCHPRPPNLCPMCLVS